MISLNTFIGMREQCLITVDRMVTVAQIICFNGSSGLNDCWQKYFGTWYNDLENEQF